MRVPSSRMFGTTYELLRDGKLVATRSGMDFRDGVIKFPKGADVNPGDSLVGKVSGQAFVVTEVTPEVVQDTIMTLMATCRKTN